jgi:DNA-binding GntR family transcriptional regulator
MRVAPLINRASLSEQAYAAIKGMIHRLELKPGQPITEAHLSALLGISKSPIRSALIHLQRDGLVAITPYKETIVSELGVERVRSIYEARALIEPHVVAAVTPRLSAADHQQIEDMLDRSERALLAEDFPVFFGINTEFHGFFVRRYGNEFFWNAYQAIDAQMERVRMISTAIMNHPQKQLAEHRQIFEAVRARGADAAGQAMKAHIAGYLDDVLAEIAAGRITWINQTETRQAAEMATR